MSLFKARDCWSTVCGVDETFDKGCFCVSSLDTDPSQSDKVLVGSHSGVLRIYEPSCNQLEDGTFVQFRPEDVLLEYKMAHPILHVAVGHFVSGSKKIYIATLHPLKLSILSFTADGDTDHGARYALSVVCEHTLQYSACCLVTGSFGGAKGRDLLCIQSLNGSLMFFEQESFAFTRFLPDVLLPGPIAYIAKTDSLVTISTALELESYRFQVLAIASETADPSQSSSSIQKGKPVVADWCFSLGEQPLDISVVELPNGLASLLILGERMLFSFKPNGIIQFSMKMDYTPACIFPYSNESGETVQMLVATQSSSLLIYQDTTLKWAARLDYTPVALARANVRGIKGMIVALSEGGMLSCCYLGTEPSLFSSPVPETRAFVFEEAERELQNLRRIISSSMSSVPSSSTPETELKVRLQTSTMSEVSSVGHDGPDDEDLVSIPAAVVKIHLQASSHLSNIRVCIDVTKPLSATPAEFTLDSLSDHHQAVITVQQTGRAIPSSLEMGVVAIFQNSSGATRLAQATLHLPLILVVRPCLPNKSWEHKVTLEMDKQTVPLNELFPEYVCDKDSQDIAMEFFDGSQVAVLASPSSQKYRLQGSCLAVLLLPALELLRRLNRYFKRVAPQADSPKFSFASSLPLQEYYDVMDKHFEVRLKVMEVEEILGHRAAQFRVVQKCVLTKLKDKTPMPLNNLDSLLDVTQRELFSLANTIVDMHKTLESALSELSCATQLMLLLTKLKASLSTEEYKLLQAAFSVDNELFMNKGWAERTEASITQLLNTSNKNGKQDDHPLPSELICPTNLSKLKKLIALIFEQVLNGGRLVLTEQPDNRGGNEAGGRYNKDVNKIEEEPFELSASSLASPTHRICTADSPQNEELQNWMPDQQDPAELENVAQT
ncbi:protein PTHB1-like [Ornithodoros turicata]|uniref:protein PTHB1-like n=1 Tax=Ornithodoros turicata TaxID=34597 RepID=UPI00313A0C86